MYLPGKPPIEQVALHGGTYGQRSDRSQSRLRREAYLCKLSQGIAGTFRSRRSLPRSGPRLRFMSADCSPAPCDGLAGKSDLPAFLGNEFVTNAVNGSEVNGVLGFRFKLLP